MKQAMLDKNSNFKNMIFAVPFEQAPVQYKEIWRWIVMEILPLISYSWKLRVNSGPSGKADRQPFFKLVTSSDLAFAYTLLAWGADKWPTANMVPESVSYSSGGSEGQRQFGGRFEGNPSGLSLGVGGAQEQKKRGRKKGEKGFASAGNVQIFNENGKTIERLVCNENNRENVKSWLEKAMMWVNQDVIEVDDDDDDCNVYKIKNENETIVPFVPRDLSAVYLVQV
jgi:hypothetical protein